MQIMAHRKILRLWPIFFLALALTACQTAAPTQTNATENSNQLTPYATGTATPTLTATPFNAPTETPLPTLTPTPQIYVLKGNETLWTIAAEAGLTVDEIKAANPGVNPYSLTAGMKIIVPPANPVSAGEGGPTPTALPLLVHTPVCDPSLTGGIYCFANVENNQKTMVQNLIAQFVLANPATGEKQVQMALLPLNHLPSGSSLPVFAYFPPPVFTSPQVDLQLLSALPDDGKNSTYLALTVANSQITIASDGLSAAVKGTASVAAAASRYWVAAVAYDAQDNVVAVRQLDNKTKLDAGASADFTLYVYSVAGKIDHVTIYGEATP